MTKKELKATIAELNSAITERDQTIKNLLNAQKKNYLIVGVTENTLLHHVRHHAGNAAEINARIAVERNVKEAESSMTCVTMSADPGVVN